MTRIPQLQNGEAGFHQLIKMLGSKDPELHIHAIDKFIWAANAFDKELILLALMVEANKPRRRINHRLGILEVEQAIGPPMGRAYLELGPLLEHRSPKLQKKAFELLTGGLPIPGAPQRRHEVPPTGLQSDP